MVPFFFDHFQGLGELWLPVKGEADVHPQVLAGLGGGGVCGMGGPHFYFVEQLGLQDEFVGGLPRVGVVQDACDFTFGVVEGDARPLAVGEDFCTL